MACTIEKVLADARLLVNSLRDNEGQAENLIAHAQNLNKRVDAMKQYQEDLNELNEIARHRPRSSLIMNLAQENTQIRELQAENRDLRLSLEEHQNALGLIMTKYREQIVKLMLANKLDRKTVTLGESAEIQAKMDKICEMAAVMQRAICIDEEAAARDEQLVRRLRLENETLRELLHISSANRLRVDPTQDTAVQTSRPGSSADDGAAGGSGGGGCGDDDDDDSDADTSSDMNDTVIEAPPAGAGGEATGGAKAEGTQESIKS